MARVLKPGGALLIANLNSFNSACADTGWVKTGAGERVHHHRPLSTYLQALLAAGLRLTYFDEPAPAANAPPERAANYRRAPWFLVMEWLKPA